MTFDTIERNVLTALADVLIPASDGFPSASQAGVAGEGLDQLLSVRPDLAPPLRRIVDAAKGRAPSDFVAELQTNDPASFGALSEAVAGAYFMNPVVRAALGYDGQSARPIEEKADYLEDGLLQAVINRGPIYRNPGNR